MSDWKTEVKALALDQSAKRGEALDDALEVIAKQLGDDNVEECCKAEEVQDIFHDYDIYGENIPDCAVDFCVGIAKWKEEMKIKLYELF